MKLVFRISEDGSEILLLHSADERNFYPGSYVPLRLISSGKLSVDWKTRKYLFLLKSLVPTQNSQDKENFFPFQSADNFREWKLAFRDLHDHTNIILSVVQIWAAI
jgi:hypothetical protein